MSDQTELDLTVPEAPREGAPLGLWYLVTNQLNLMYLLAAGLVTGPKGFGRKYYHDPLAVAPGWIPLFREPFPEGALTQSTREEPYLQVVAAAVDLGPLRGSVQAIDDQGRLRALQWPDEAAGNDVVLLVPVPLPVDWVQTILFPSKEARDAFREQAGDYSNVPLDGRKLQVRAKSFQPGGGPVWPPTGPLPVERDRSLHQASAVGATQALLVGLGNRGLALTRAARRLDGLAGGSDEPPEGPYLAAVLGWAQGVGGKDQVEVQTRILHRLLATIVGAKGAADTAAGTSCPPDFRRVVLDVLDEERQRLSEPKWQEALIRLIDDLQGLVGLGGATISELLVLHSRAFSRGLILFFLRQRCDELLALATERAELTDQDLVVAAALFGARDGWLGLPPALKSTPGLSTAITHRMATLVHQEAGTGIDLGPTPPRVCALLEILGPGGAGWTQRQREAALVLARGMGWQGVLRTRISLGKGDYRVRVDGRGLHLLIDGDVKAVQTEVDSDLLFQSLGREAIPRKLESEVRSALQS